MTRFITVNDLGNLNTQIILEDEPLATLLEVADQLNHLFAQGGYDITCFVEEIGEVTPHE